MTIGFVGSCFAPNHNQPLLQALKYIFTNSEEHTLLAEPSFRNHLEEVGLIKEKEIGELSKKGVKEVDLIITIGGDGTFLRGAKLVAGTPSAVLGVNAGRLGFLASLSATTLIEHWWEILEGELQIELRRMLRVESQSDPAKTVLYGEALNEVSVLRRDIASMMIIDANINGEYMASYEGDGLIIATPTGSTAYALSAQGPIIDPSCDVFLLCPLAPHMLNMRPLVIPPEVTLDLSLQSRNDTFLLALDGKSLPLPTTTKLRITPSDQMVRVAHLKESYSYYQTLRTKLMWGHNTREIKQ